MGSILALRAAGALHRASRRSAFDVTTGRAFGYGRPPFRHPNPTRTSHAQPSRHSARPRRRHHRRRRRHRPRRRQAVRRRSASSRHRRSRPGRRSTRRRRTIAAASPGKNAEVLTVRCDVSRMDDVREPQGAGLCRAFGEVGVLMNNAGTGPGGGPFDHYDRWQHVIGVNLWGVINGVHAFTRGDDRAGHRRDDRQHRVEAGHHLPAGRHRLQRVEGGREGDHRGAAACAPEHAGLQGERPSPGAGLDPHRAHRAGGRRRSRRARGGRTRSST